MRILLLLVLFIFRTTITMEESLLDLDLWQQDFENNLCTYICQVADCKKFFTSIELLHMHKKTHTKLYQCCMPGCQKQYSTKKDFREHTIRKHAIVHQFLECNYKKCGRILISSNDLIDHIDEHKVHIPQKRPRCFDFDDYMDDPKVQKKFKNTESDDETLKKIFDETSEDSTDLDSVVKLEQSDSAHNCLKTPLTP